MAEAALRLIGGGAGGAEFDDRRWRWSVRDSRALHGLAGAASSVLFLLYALADSNGEMDAPQTWLRDQIGCRSTRSIARALAELGERGLIEDAGRSRKDPRVRRYRLIAPEPAMATSAAQNADRVSQTAAKTDDTDVHREGPTGPPTGHLCHGYRTSVSRIPDTSVHQRVRKESGKKKPPPPRARCAPDVTLWDKQPRDAAAAAALIFWARLGVAEANGLVTHYRPTRRQVLNVMANAFAWRRAHRLGRRGAMNDLRGFVRGEIARGRFVLDDAVYAFRQERRQRAESRCLNATATPPGARPPVMKTTAVADRIATVEERREALAAMRAALK